MTHEVDGLDEVLSRAAGDEALDPTLQPVFDTLQRLRTTPERDPHQVAAGRQAFLDRAAVLPVPQPSFLRHKSGTHDGRKELRPMSALAGLLVALALLFGGGGATALAAQDAMPTDWLYPVKLATENVQLTLAGGPAETMELLGNWIDRRLWEMEQLTLAGEVVPLEPARRLQSQLGLAMQTASQFGDPALAQVMQRLQVQLETRLQTMQRLRQADPHGAALQSAEQALIQTQAEIQGALQDPAAFRTRFGAGRPSDAPRQPSVAPGQPEAGPAVSPSMAGPGDEQGQDAPAGSGPGDGSCQRFTQVPDGTDCPTCTPNLWLTPGPHGNGQGAGGH
ncbi:MAG: hypothetical protein FJZ97_01055 [Chloroflexi bacterium]|nr:hypothetical protein [Chloroflexota bacterium]